jgi:hypothetical protein
MKLSLLELIASIDVVKVEVDNEPIKRMVLTVENGNTIGPFLVLHKTTLVNTLKRAIETLENQPMKLCCPHCKCTSFIITASRLSEQLDIKCSSDEGCGALIGYVVPDQIFGKPEYVE